MFASVHHGLGIYTRQNQKNTSILPTDAVSLHQNLLGKTKPKKIIVTWMVVSKFLKHLPVLSKEKTKVNCKNKERKKKVSFFFFKWPHDLSSVVGAWPYCC
jgi:hypothetical protein